MKKHILTGCFILSLCLAATKISAQNVVQTHTAPFLEIRSDARSASMGGMASNVTGGAYGIFGNASANLFSGAMYGGGVSMSAREDFSDHNLYSVGGFYNLNSRNGFSLGFRHFAGSKITIGNDKGKPTDFSIDVAYTRRIVDNLAVSVTAKFINSDIVAGSGSAFAVDLGAYYEMGHVRELKLRIGATLSNLGTRINYGGDSDYDLPAAVGVGGAVSTLLGDKHMLTGEVNFRHRFMPSDFTTSEGGVGVEYGFDNMLFARVGAHLGDKEKGFGNFATFGLGFACRYFRIDASYWGWVPNKDYRNIIYLSLSAMF